MRFIKSDKNSKRDKIHIFVDDLRDFNIIKSVCCNLVIDERRSGTTRQFESFTEIPNKEMIKLIEEEKIKEADFCKMCLLSLQKTPYKKSKIFLDEGEAAKKVIKMSEEYYEEFNRNKRRQIKLNKVNSRDFSRDLSSFIVLDKLPQRA